MSRGPNSPHGYSQTFLNPSKGFQIRPGWRPEKVRTSAPSNEGGGECALKFPNCLRARARANSKNFSKRPRPQQF
jgi:hypothetical protein